MFDATQRQRHWVVGLIVIGLAVGSSAFITDAQGREPQPSDYYFIEFITGNWGALLGGGGAVLIAYGVSYLLYSPLYPCDRNCRVAEEWIYRIAFLSGISIGSTYGVIEAGSYKNVHGNTLAALAGAILGGTVGLSAVFGFSGSMEHQTLFPVLVLLSALGATIGYNINATVEPVVLSPTNQGFVLVGLKTQLSI